MSLIQSAPLSETVAALRSGALDLLAYVESAVDRLEQVDAEVQAFLPEPGRRERLRREAAALAAGFPDPAARPPLYGALIGVKDIFRVDGFETRAGSTLSPTLFEGAEAAVVTQLKRLGALVLGKTVTAEFAYFEPGPTRNPHNLAHTPGGSSSGSAAGVAAGLVPLALGTQTIGSIVRPASYCGIVGYKPSYGRLSTEGVLPVSKALDHVGLFTQDIDGMALAASLLCADWRPAGEVERPRLGVLTGAYLAQASDEMIAAFDGWVARLEQAGFSVQRLDMLDDIETIGDQCRKLMAYEAAQVHAGWFAAYSEQYRPRTAGLIQTGQSVSAEIAAEARAAQMNVRRRVEDAMREAGIDVWISPAAAGPAPHGLESTGAPWMNLLWTFIGLPAVTMPAGRSADGLPLGLQMAGAYGDDERLLAWAGVVGRTLKQE
ncbi:MAG: amidase [Chloroflexi bacterium]|nr:amidase [Chloroflexota bacterium]